MAIQIGKYKRPGIFLEEYDNSVISTPVVEGLTNLVLGVSKKGPVNTPIRVTNTTDLEAIFGQLDRGLERKGSFFHRTVSKMLETAPVFAINLLLTDDNLDVIEYKSLSTSADYINDIEREGPYRRFFDTTGFWKRDTESFINLTKNNTGYSERAFSLTNLSDRYATVFVFKSAMAGFDRTLIEWYGSVEKMPTYVSANDYASDYMVDVVIVGGDWSNYKDLAVDARWSAYFNATGLRKEKVREFANDRNVTLLSYYEGLSLIPYFRDSNGRNIFIETVINRDTDRTGVFCAFNNDLVETDFFNGKLDLIGHTIAGKNETDIEFLSYQEKISEKIEMTATPLDLPGNVTALLGGTGSIYPSLWEYQSSGITHAFKTPKAKGWVQNGNNRTQYFAEGYVYNIEQNGSAVSTTSSITVNYQMIDSDLEAFSVVGDKQVIITATAPSLVISASNYPFSATVATFSSAFVLDSTGKFKVVNSTNANSPSVASSDIVLGYIKFGVQNQQIIGSPAVVPVNIGTNGYVNYVFGTASGADYYVENLGNGSIKVSFTDTDSSPSVKNYKQYRRFKMFNRLVDLIDSPNRGKMAMLISATSQEKRSMEGMTITNIVTSSTQDKSFVLNTGLDASLISDVIKGFLAFYTVDNEFIIGAKGVVTKDTVADEAEYGVVAKYSKFYTRYFDGAINTGDYFFANKVPQDILEKANDLPYVEGEEYIKDVYFFDGESALSVFGLTAGLGLGPTSSYAGYDFIAFNMTADPELAVYDVISIEGATLNTGTFTIVSDENYAPIMGTAGLWNYVYKVNEETVYERVQDVSIMNFINTKHYLKMFIDADGKLTTHFMDETFTGFEVVNTNTAGTFNVNSAITNYKQTLEVEVPAGYVQIPNKVLVNGARYTEVRVGDFLEADNTATLKIGEYPRKLTRIVGKRQYAGNPDLVEISCDAAIKKVSFSGDLQTTRYKTVDNYATTYKAISLKGFRVREASLPDGTEARQNAILNLVSKGTPLFKALTNKEAIDFRYLIDSFGLGLTERSKQQLVDICGDRLDAFGFINMPSMKAFKNSSSPTFVNAEGVLQAEFIAKGGDPESGPAFLYSFGDGAGTTCTGYFMPYLTVNDNGRPLDMPPASHVATTYMRKHISNVGSITPWTIAAGVTNGRITNIAGIEQDFTPSDIEWLNQAQMNPIVFKRNRGNVIETENTAQTLYKSALSYIHVREVLIELERELSRMLLDFQWRYNTADIRAEIKLRADVICETYVSKNGLYNYFNKMDEENNTPEIIDNQIGVLDTYVEPIKGMGVIVNNVTILRTGAIAAGGFA